MRSFLLLAVLGLTGFVTRPDVMNLPAFKARYEQVQIDETVLNGLSGNGVSVMVVFGDWCSDSVEHVPEFMKIDDRLHFSDVQWVAVGRKLADDTGIVEAFHIERVPTFVFMVNGEEIGRIIEHPHETMEKDTAAILARLKK